MYRIRIHGRGGQGIKMASRVLGTALFRAGYQVQDAPKYGAERRGAPIFSYVRAAREPINERGLIQQPDLVVVADDTLMAVPAAGTLLGLAANSVVLLNSHQTSETWRHRLNLEARLLILPAAAEAEDRAELPQIGATCAGAAARLLGMVERSMLEQAIEEELAELGPDIVASNLDSALQAFDAMTEHQGLVTEGATVSAEAYLPPEWIELPFEDAGVSAPDIRAAANSVQVRTGLWRTMRPVIDHDHCKQCWWICSTFCPDSAILVENDSPVIDYDHCKGCMVCVGVCPPHAISGMPEYLAAQAETAQQDPSTATGGETDGAETTDR